MLTVHACKSTSVGHTPSLTSPLGHACKDDESRRARLRERTRKGVLSSSGETRLEKSPINFAWQQGVATRWLYCLRHRPRHVARWHAAVAWAPGRQIRGDPGRLLASRESTSTTAPHVQTSKAPQHDAVLGGIPRGWSDMPSTGSTFQLPTGASPLLPRPQKQILM